MATLQTILQTDSGSQAVEKINGNFSALNEDIQQAGQGGGSTPSTPAAWQSMWVLGDSTASDGYMNNTTYITRYTTVNVYRALARMAGVAAAAYHNHASHGTTVVSNLASQAANVTSSADIVFIQMGINDITQNKTVGNIDDVLAGTDTTSVLGKYFAVLQSLRTTATNAKIVCVTPLYAGGGKESTHSARLASLRNGIRTMCEHLGGEAGGYYCISGLAVGVHSANVTALYADNDLHPNKDGAITIAYHIMHALACMGQDVLPDLPNATVSPHTLTITTSAGVNATDTFTFNGEYFGDATVSVENLAGSSNKSMFEVSPTSISQTGKLTKDAVITVTFKPAAGTAAGNYGVMIKVASPQGTWTRCEVTGVVQ